MSTHPFRINFFDSILARFGHSDQFQVDIERYKSLGKCHMSTTSRKHILKYHNFSIFSFRLNDTNNAIVGNNDTAATAFKPSTAATAADIGTATAAVAALGIDFRV